IRALEPLLEVRLKAPAIDSNDVALAPQTRDFALGDDVASLRSDTSHCKTVSARKRAPAAPRSSSDSAVRPASRPSTQGKYRGHAPSIAGHTPRVGVSAVESHARPGAEIPEL